MFRQMYWSLRDFSRCGTTSSLCSLQQLWQVFSSDTTMFLVSSERFKAFLHCSIVSEVDFFRLHVMMARVSKDIGGGGEPWVQ